MTYTPRPDEVWLDPLDAYEVERVDRLFDRLTSYALAVDGVEKTIDAARQFLRALPPGRDAASKATFEIRRGYEPIGLVDLIAGYPQDGTMFIGLLAIVEDRHRQGSGRAAFQALEAHARRRRAQTLRLAVVDGNPVEGFWTKMGFRRTGEVRPHRGEARCGLAILMEKALFAG